MIASRLARVLAQIDEDLLQLHGIEEAVHGLRRGENHGVKAYGVPEVLKKALPRDRLAPWARQARDLAVGL